MNISVLKKQATPVNMKKAAKAAKKAARQVAGMRKKPQAAPAQDLGLLVLRATTGGLLAGHGAQKLFGWFEGPGFEGFSGFMDSMGLKPGTFWSSAATAGEFGGGVLNALGLFHPLGPMAMMGAMIMATAKVHWGKPIWASAGGAELPMTNAAAALSIALIGPGRISLDRLFGIRLPRALVIAAAIAEAAVLARGIMSHPEPSPASTGSDKPAPSTATAQQQ
jgi:putative oxidoreductase